MEIKICGLKTADTVSAAVEAGADLVGFVFFARSPRCVTAAGAAALAARVPAGVIRTGLFVDAADAEIAAVLETAPLDLLQLHGWETPRRCAEVRARFGLPVMKALGIASAADVAAARAYEEVCDRLLFDAKPGPGATRPGGNSQAFEWSLLAGSTWSVPWLLAGGLTASNVAAAIAASGAPGVDVSSGVEDAPGVKNPDRIRLFIKAARAAEKVGQT
jgi:phosphoribosylanthranilate isomerase